jgi:hypothetical protein
MVTVILRFGEDPTLIRVTSFRDGMSMTGTESLFTVAT